ncbi:HupE/UreJ family protein [Mucilaginibacter myungsuensis]|uniref:HupE/UreJ family protein n=1 Tax=Mucilaginibacter myungsuensis TaxID=649104 RepID=A0A929KUU9_9SPHI|nr:HupE/UreJ family protein [Mucilaginibacter myungsuensis]MBE9661989.1 HupE/UreJ family protein [Mucilaginibacter myungsuensis]MDN3599578.1 HupE/UreJ family protein [Mucilaginibacter myungsuensis]
MSDFSFYFGLGWHHIISADALDHQLFILALAAVYTFKNIKQVLILVTAFTIGHSLTLALSILDVFRFSSAWVEFLIPCTIFITALNNLFQADKAGRSAKINYYLALGFGLIHGMGFANSVRIMLARDQSVGMGLFGFNVGLEAGQIVVVAAILVIGWLTLNYAKVKQRDWIFFLSSSVFALALKMALERLPF